MLHTSVSHCEQTRVREEKILSHSNEEKVGYLVLCCDSIAQTTQCNQMNILSFLREV